MAWKGGGDLRCHFGSAEILKVCSSQGSRRDSNFNTGVEKWSPFVQILLARALGQELHKSGVFGLGNFWSFGGWWVGGGSRLR